MTSKSSTCCELIDGLKQFSNIRYVAYRTAAKVKFIQEETNLCSVKLQHIFQELEKLGFGSGDRDLILNRSEAIRILGGIFHQAQRMVLIDLNKKASSSLVADFIEKTYLRNGKGATLLDLVVFLTVLCGGLEILEKYKKLLHFICNDSNMINRNALELLLKSIANIAHLVSEASAFGKWTVFNAIDQCFGKFEGGLNEIPLNAVLEWFMCQPQSLVWWTTLSRLTASSKVIHSVRCSVCNAPQIQGLRYQCLKCLCYNQCQQCFWSGLISKNHKIHHQMQEYCSKTTSKEATRALWKKMSNWLALKKKGMRSAQYLPFDKAAKISDLAMSTEHLNSFNTLSSDAVNAAELRGSDQESVTDVVRDLIEEKARLENILRNAHSTNSLFPIVEEHCKQLELQLRRLCNNPQQQRSKSIFPRLPKILNRLESTPLLTKDQRNATLEALSYSPIDEPQSIMMRAQPQRLSLRMPPRTASTVSSSFYTPHMAKRTATTSPVESYLNEPPRFMTDFTLKDLSRDMQQLREQTAIAPLLNDTSDSQLNEELEAILVQLDQLFPVSPSAKLCDTAAPIAGATDIQNLTLVKASNQVAGALAEFLDGFKE